MMNQLLKVLVDSSAVKSASHCEVSAEMSSSPIYPSKRRLCAHYKVRDADLLSLYNWGDVTTLYSLFSCFTFNIIKGLLNAFLDF